MITRPSGSIHALVAVMDFVKLPQYGHFVFDPMRPVEPAIVDKKRRENQRQDFQPGSEDWESANAVEGEGDRFPREQVAQLATPQAGGNAERQRKKSCR